MKNSHSVLAAMSRLSRVSDTKPTMPKLTFRGQDNKPPSLDTGVGNATAKPIMVYTGDKMIGIGQLHKSNAVPIFRQEDAEDLAKMRR